MTVRSIVICALAAIPLAGCYGLYGHDEFDRYAQRTDVITMSAGDAKEVNARTHSLTPWPGYVGDRRIPMAGTRAAKAIECYNLGSAATKPTTTSQTNIGISTETGASAQTTSQTSSKC